MAKEIHLYQYPSRFSKNKLKILLYYPNSYFLGMSNLGFLTIYHQLKNIEEVYCERGFFPSLKSFETETSIKEFDIIIFSISFEIDFINIIKVLLKANIELYSKQRNKPFIAAGGIAVTLNPFLFQNIFNMQFIGEGEELIIKFVEEYLGGKNFSNIKGIFTHNSKLERIIYNGNFVAHSVILSSETEFANTFLIEIARGCPFRCNFCAVSYNYSPFRVRRKDKIIELIDEHKTHFNKVGLISSSVLSHPDFLEIGEFLLRNNKKFSISSMRLDNLNDEIVKLLKNGGATTFTVAIEAGSERLRKKINKKLTDDQIFKAIEILIKNKVLNLKFYFMIGLPYEEWIDIEEIINIISKIKLRYLENKKYLKHLGKFTVSVNPFIPKRNTPFFKYRIEKIDILQKKIIFLKKSLKKMPNVEFIYENLYFAYMQYFLSKGDEKLVELLIEKVKKNISNKKFIDKINEIYY